MAGPGRNVRFLAGVVAAIAAAGLAGCVKGVGDPCQQHAECLPGLACESGKCTTCGDGQACLPVDLVVKACDAAKNPLEGVTDLRITVTGEGLSPIVQVAKVNDHTVSLPKVPFGKGREITVEGLDGPEGAVKARGSSGLFDVKADEATSSRTVFLRKVQQFTPVNGRATNEVCTEMTQPRAGHTATRLQDGRVLIAGGYAYDTAGKKTYLKTVEIYDPRSGSFTTLPQGLTLPRAGHTASLLPNGKVLLAGGTSIINDLESGLSTAELFDPATSTFKFIVMKERRERHSAAVLPSGVVMITGGVRDPPPNNRYPTDRTEFFSPNTETFTVGPTMSKQRADHSSIAIDAERVLVIGGTDGENPLASVDVFHYINGAFVLEQPSGAPSYVLAAARKNPLAVSLDAGDGKAGVLVAGAPASGGASANDAWDWLPATQGTTVARDVQQLPTPRNEACAAAFDGGVVVVGGRDKNGNLLASADDYFIATNGKLTSGKAGAISSPRTKLACTALADGTVLVTGGEGLDGSKKIVSGGAEIFQPMP